MSYWSDRVEELKKWMEKNEGKLKKRLSSYYDKEWAKLDIDIASYYTKYGKDSVIEYRKLMESLSDDDFQLLMKKMNDFAEKYPEYAYLMPIRESIYKLNRLEGLQYSITMQQLEMGAKTIDEVNDYLKELSLKSVNIAAETMGFGKNFYSINSDVVRQFVNVPWCNGKNFSTRIWENTSKLAQYLNTDVSQAFARGDSYKRIEETLRRRFSNVSRNDAYRLIYTEGTYVMAEATMHPFEKEFDQYKISTADDGKVCSVCKEIAEKTFKIAERQAGINFPPFHPWCRCSHEIVVDDWEKWIDDYVERHGTNEKNTAKNIKRRIDGNKKEKANEKRRILV